MTASKPASSAPLDNHDARKEKVMKQVAIHRASSMAVAAKKAELQSTTKTPSSFAILSKAVIEMEILALSARLLILEELEPLDDQEKMELLFQILDKKRDGSLSVVELADGLRKIRGDVNFEESIALAMERVAEFDKDGDAKMQYGEFKIYVQKLSESFGTTFHELAEMLILSVVFEDGNDDVENMFAAIADEEITLALKEETTLEKIMNDDRMKVLFHMFDTDCDDSVDFIELVRGLYKITNHLDEATTTAVIALLKFDEEGNDRFDYEEFTRFILNLISAMGQTFDECIFQMTKAAAEENKMTKEELEAAMLEMA